MIPVIQTREKDWGQSLTVGTFSVHGILSSKAPDQRVRSIGWVVLELQVEACQPHS